MNTSFEYIKKLMVEHMEACDMLIADGGGDTWQRLKNNPLADRDVDEAATGIINIRAEMLWFTDRWLRLEIRKSLASEIAAACTELIEKGRSNIHIVACRDLWLWLSKNPTKGKNEYPEHDGNLFGWHACPACTECDKICQNCFLLETWGSDPCGGVPCLNECSPYRRWVLASGHDEH